MKVAPILRALAREPSPWTPVLVHTGQHYDDGMSDVFFRQLGIANPDVYLGVGSGHHGAQTAKILASFEELLLSASPPPRGVVVVGDVNSTLACTLAAAKLGIPVAHVEAGLRSFDRTMPEEINRVVTDALAEVLFLTEESARINLLREGIPDERVWMVGNVMIDTLVAELTSARSLEMPGRLGLSPGGYALVTLHRPSNVDTAERLHPIVRVLEAIAARMPVVFPVHPRTRERLNRFGLFARLEGHPALRLGDPLGYRENLGLMASARVVLTDSGGIQEEASYLGVPCLTLRPNTERPVTVALGTNTVVGDDFDLTARLVEDVLSGRYKKGGPIPLWDGHAAERIVATLAETWGDNGRALRRL
jgi:UDP-N-acetylglucosamine 2-epimerase (non-hydrolysing)